jgi:hypothetical protein
VNFGYSADDAAMLVHLAQKTLRGVKQAFGDHDELTREVSSIYRVLKRLRRELANSDSFLNRAEDDRRQDLNGLGHGCERILTLTNSIVNKYNALPEDKRNGKKSWPKEKFQNGEMQDLAEIRRKLSAHTAAISMCLDLCSSRGQGRIEKQLRNLGELEGIRETAANMTARTGDGTVWTSYKDDDSAFWKKLRRELVKKGYRSSVLSKHERLIREYVEELGRQGVFDQKDDAQADNVNMDDERMEDVKIENAKIEHAKVEGAEATAKEAENVEEDEDAEDLDVEDAAATADLEPKDTEMDATNAVPQSSLLSMLEILQFGLSSQANESSSFLPLSADGQDSDPHPASPEILPITYQIWETNCKGLGILKACSGGRRFRRGLSTRCAPKRSWD